MTYEEFRQRGTAGPAFWGVTDLSKAVWLLDGRAGMRGLWVERLVVLLPGVIFAIYCVLSRHYWGLVWSLLSLLAAGSGRTDISCGGGCIWLPAIVVGLVLSSRGLQNPVGGMLPLLSYFLSSIHRGTTVHEIGRRIALSESDYNRLNAGGALFFVDPVAPPG